MYTTRARVRILHTHTYRHANFAKKKDATTNIRINKKKTSNIREFCNSKKNKKLHVRTYTQNHKDMHHVYATLEKPFYQICHYLIISVVF